MMALAGLCGSLCGFGLLVGFTKPNASAATTKRPSRPSELTPSMIVWIAAGLVAAAVVALATHWPVAGIAGGTGVAFALRSLMGGGNTMDDVARIEGLAGWAEQLRDTLVAGHGITETIRTTADVCPPAIRSSVQSLARRIQHQRLDTALRAWTDELDDPTADLIASVLLIAATRAGRDVGRLLGAMAEVARDRVAMRLRIDSHRASTRTEARSLVGFSIGFFVLLSVFGGSFMHPYRSFAGQTVMAVVGLFVAAALWWLARLGRFRRTPRVLKLSDGALR